jgi:hypothetical protein
VDGLSTTKVIMSAPLNDKTQGWHNATDNAEFGTKHISSNAGLAWDDDGGIDASSNTDSELSDVEVDGNPCIDFDNGLDLGPDDMFMFSTYDMQASYGGVSDNLITFQVSEAAEFKTGSSTGQNPNLASESIKGATKEDMRAKTAIAMLKLQNFTTNSKDGLLRQWSRVLFDIFDQYQRQAANNAPQNVALQHGIDFGDYKGPCVATLLQVLQLLPEAYQKHVLAADDEREQQIHKSWLCEHIIDVVIRLSCSLYSRDTLFGRKLCAGLSEGLDAFYRTYHSMRFLEYQIQQAKRGSADPNTWNLGGVYTFPLTTKTIVFYYNYTEAHFVAVKLNIKQTG